jgi:diguanylate cyclase (GGDEF)-like protein
MLSELQFAADAHAALETNTLLDTLGALLQTLGRHAFDIDELDAGAINQSCEGWARHILVGSSPPDGFTGVLPSMADSFHATSTLQRDWEGLLEFVSQLRLREYDYVTGNVRGIRRVIGDFALTIGKVFAEDQRGRSRVTTALDNLKQAIESNAPLEQLSREVMRAVDQISQIVEENKRRHQSVLEELTNKLKTMRHELDEARHEMELDPLSRLFNRRAFDKQLARIFELNKLTGQSASLLMLDVDHFKSINDRYGHPAGDQILRQLADCCLRVFPRKADFVARYGGEEYVIILQDTALNTAIMLGERLLEAIRVLRVPHGPTAIQITASIGVADLDSCASPAQWLEQADSALYRAKREGRDRLGF